MSEKKVTFPKIKHGQDLVCYRCGLAVTGPFQASGYAPRSGSMKGQCTGQFGCSAITFFDYEDEDSTKEEAAK